MDLSHILLTVIAPVLLLLLAGIGGLIMFLHNLVFKKLDRMTLLFMHHEDQVKGDINSNRRDIACLGERVAAVETKVNK